ncbi:uncharacterized protein METZ01_LOCUS103523, partial [marine metagenome]
VGCGGPGFDSASSVHEAVVEPVAFDIVVLSVEGMT